MVVPALSLTAISPNGFKTFPPLKYEQPATSNGIERAVVQRMFFVKGIVDLPQGNGPLDFLVACKRGLKISTEYLHFDDKWLSLTVHSWLWPQCQNIHVHIQFYTQAKQILKCGMRG